MRGEQKNSKGTKRAMETRVTAIKAGQRRHKWAMVQATATVMYPKGSSFYNSIINKDSPWMLARQCDNDEQQFELPPSLNTVSLRRISFFSEIRSPRSVTPFFCQNTPFPPKSNKTAPAAKPLLACTFNNVLFCRSCYHHSHLIIPWLAQILGYVVTCGVKMMQLCQNWCW